MKLAVLFSGGKDSCYALWKAQQYHDVVCLISLVSSNPDSYMFHTPNITLTQHQAKAIGLPLVTQETLGEKEAEILDLTKALVRAKKEHGIQGVVTGAIASVYQSTRIQRVCQELKLWCFNLLWQRDQEEYMKELLKNKFEIIISAVAAEPFTKEWLGKKLTKKDVDQLITWKKKYGLNPAGEGGEYETFVTNAPCFKHSLTTLIKKTTFEGHAGKADIEVLP